MHRRLLANILLVVLPWILAASACDLKKSPGMFTVNFVWPEGVKPSPTLTLYARAVLNWLPDGSQVNDNGEVPLASGTPELTFDGLNYERPYTLTVEIFEKTAQKTQVVYFGKSKEFTLKADKTTIVEVAVPLKPAPGRKNDGTPAPIAPRIAEVRNGVFVTVSNVTIHYHAENAETVSISNEPTFGSGEDFTIGDRTSSGEYSLPWDLNSVLGDTDGQRTVYLKLSNDHAYETDLEAMTVIYDHAAPVVTIDDPKPPQVTNSVSATLLFSCNEDVCNLTCSLNESEFQTCDSPKEYSDLSDGKYAFSVQATDLAGNAAPAAYEWTIDTKPCDTVITSAPENQTNPLSVSFEFSATDNGEPCPSCTFECEIDGDAWTACTSPKSYSALPEGPHDFSVRCTDHAGNTDPSPPSHTWVSACDPSPTGKGGDMCDVPAGAFMMGCNVAVDTECYSDEKPYHSVTVPWFKIDKYEVTAAEYKACVTASGCTAAKTESGCNYNVAGKESHPINCVDWNQAKAYCTWVGKKLPTEAEWEKAARGTDGRKYPWGNDVLDCNRAVHPVSPCSNSGTATVDSKPTGASPYGAMDMVGNVWEWVEDDWHDTYTSAPSDGSAWVDAPRGSSRVLRGGGWRNYGSRGLRASVRVNYNPTFRYFYIGFRCSRDGI